jgi:hypothetical protein
MTETIITDQRTFVPNSKFKEDSVLCFSAEASELGWPPGFFPEQFDTNIGNKQPMMLVGFNAGYAIYTQSAGCIYLKVYND